MKRDTLLATAAHEAAHVVVGAALGLRLHSASIVRDGDVLGHAWFPYGPSWSLAVMYAAGIAWEGADPRGHARYDRDELRALLKSAAGCRAAVTCAAALLETRVAIHRRVTAALLEGDLNDQGLASLAHGGVRRRRRRVSHGGARRVSLR